MDKFPPRKKFFLIPVFIIAFLALAGFLVMTLWNNILVSVLHVGAVTFWQALGILLLCKILFGMHGGGAPWKGRRQWRMRERWMNMSPEEKEKFKQEWKKRCGPFGRPDFNETRAAGEEPVS